jgi:hypothetical protein
VTRPYRHEWLVLLLVGLTGLSFFHEVSPQDITRLALTEAVVLDGSLRIDRWQDQTPDKAEYEGRYYSDKAPGLSFLAVPSFALLRWAGILREENELAGIWKDRSDVWMLRALTGGLGFLVAVFLVGRVAEGVERGTGAATATAFGLGTLALPLAATMFAHVVAGALGFAAFVAAWSGLRAEGRRELYWAAGGLCAGIAVLVEYQSVFIAAVVLVYLATRTLRAALVFAAAAVPCAIALGVYNAAAFGSPLHLSYRYVAEEFATEQAEGFFGIGVPDPGRVFRILFTWDGLLLRSPLLVAAAVGLVLLWRKGLRAEAAVCGTTTLVFLTVNAGYYDPLGGGSPGPRFFVPALPFLAVGLACTFRRWPLLTLAVATLSGGLMLYRTGTWFWLDEGRFWTIWALLGSPRTLGALVPLALSLSALAIAARELLLTDPRASARMRHRLRPGEIPSDL